MREIKFRAWDEKNNVMHNDFQFIKSGDSGNDWIIFISDKFPLTEHKTNPFMNPNPFFAQQLKIMQYTGLKDKNGKEIYEGDILKSDKMKTLMPVKWFAEGAGYSLAWIGKDRHNVKVIGNIYKNPNLLNHKEK